jgi:hypothetical protein
MRRSAAALACVLAVASIAAGCGGSDSTTSDSESASAPAEWANDLCNAVATWATNVRGAAGSLADDRTSAGLQDAVEDVEDATAALSQSLDELGKPNLAASDSARATVDTLEQELSASAAKLQSETEDVSGPRGVVEAAPAVSASLVAMGNDIAQAVDSLKGLRGEGSAELKQAFSQSTTCNDIHDALS